MPLDLPETILRKEHDRRTSDHLHCYAEWLKDLREDHPELHTRALEVAQKFDELIAALGKV